MCNDIKNNFYHVFLTINIFIVLNSCEKKTDKDFINEKAYFNFNNNLEAYRLLYNYDYSSKPDRKSFWSNGKYNSDFAIHQMNVSYEYLLEEIRKLPKTNLPLEDYDYAFVENCRDTLYSNYCLDHWEVIYKGISEYYIFPDSLRFKFKNNLRRIITDDNFLKKEECLVPR